jgi:hypothetical protein
VQNLSAPFLHEMACLFHHAAYTQGWEVFEIRESRLQGGMAYVMFTNNRILQSSLFNRSKELKSLIGAAYGSNYLSDFFFARFEGLKGRRVLARHMVTWEFQPIEPLYGSYPMVELGEL